jgi:hypothetical protein
MPQSIMKLQKKKAKTNVSLKSLKYDPDTKHDPMKQPSERRNGAFDSNGRY